uniref:Uncharacterized protein n=1 Tax=Picea glauca TaxID=3330 RepID=A0A101LXL1_PICGL|nr:hypothetical protein ABT39_MTgene6211 [Picea glauca]
MGRKLFPSKALFQSLAIKEASKQLTSLKEGGRHITEQEAIEREFVTQYKSVLKAQDYKERIKSAMHKCLERIPIKVSEEKKIPVTKPLLYMSLQLPSNKLKTRAPGLDGFLCELYKATWAFVRPDLLQVYKEALHKQSLGVDINQGLIKVIAKGGDPELITNSRTITLMNT